MRISALYIILINKNFWIPAFAGMTSLGHFQTDCFAGMTGSGYFRTDCSAGMTSWMLYIILNNFIRVYSCSFVVN